MKAWKCLRALNSFCQKNREDANPVIIKESVHGFETNPLSPIRFSRPNLRAIKPLAEGTGVGLDEQEGRGVGGEWNPVVRR